MKSTTDLVFSQAIFICSIVCYFEEEVDVEITAKLFVISTDGKGDTAKQQIFHVSSKTRRDKFVPTTMLRLHNSNITLFISQCVRQTLSSDAFNEDHSFVKEREFE